MVVAFGRNNRVALQEKQVVGITKRVRHRVVPGKIDMVPAGTELYHVPGMVHFLARNHNTVDAEPVKQVFIRERVALADCLLAD